MIFLNFKWREIGRWDHDDDYYEDPDDGPIETPYPGMTTLSLLDTDLRREIFVMAPTNVFFSDESGDRAMILNAVEQIYPTMSPTAFMIRIDDQGRMASVSSDPEMLKAVRAISGYIPSIADAVRPLLTDIGLPDVPTTSYLELVELDRFTPTVDLMRLAHNPETQLVCKVVFSEWDGNELWTEMNVFNSIRPHPSIPRCHSLVVDNGGHVIGMTSRFIPGGDLASNKHRTFKLKWLQQLTELIDFLHLDQGIVHNKIELSNIVIDEAADRLMLIDFGLAAWTSKDRVIQDVFQVTWTLYELITHDFVSRTEQVDPVSGRMDPRAIVRMSVWPINGKLDCDVGEFRSHLVGWAKKRLSNLNFAPNNQLHLPLPHMPQDPGRIDNYYLVSSVGVNWQRPSYAATYPDRVAEARKGDLMSQVLPPVYEPSNMAALSYKMDYRWDPSPDTDPVEVADSGNGKKRKWTDFFSELAFGRAAEKRPKLGPDSDVRGEESSPAVEQRMEEIERDHTLPDADEDAYLRKVQTLNEMRNKRVREEVEQPEEQPPAKRPKTPPTAEDEAYIRKIRTLNDMRRRYANRD